MKHRNGQQKRSTKSSHENETFHNIQNKKPRDAVMTPVRLGIVWEKRVPMRASITPSAPPIWYAIALKISQHILRKYKKVMRT